MRWIFLSLLSLNAIVFLVQWLELQKRHSASVNHARIQVYENAGTLTLLSEIKLFPAKKEKLEDGSSADKGVKSNVEALCFLIGPLEEEVEAEELRKGLLLEQVETRLHKNTLQLAPEYWVYLRPLESRKAAIIRLKELQVRKIDSYLIAQGELRNGISLGLFRNIDSAKLLQKQRIRQGFQAEMKELPREKLEYWLVSEDEANMQLMGRINSVLGSQKNNVEARQIFCKSVASGGDLP
ncbi:hypothetical protein BTA51_24145 [Hahella sp. CCB-MM4]|uniref:hypothetical protein n=1 Tax=Hahella sp. (strain CCB-MM4) TaxID=1926491 RepID=UPI000B9B657E|nr:hypothetical protein [Hahella sp. CCB-MM4]OZG70926.1 hypothetical protein BTA51_24145 [Hahella sp. CCB-MM4]